ncbi:Pvc16 family protein [Nonomuraea bangladeshensis]|uniref:Pvc16 family protein n=1 Tax=Nonomuraea bangladeshensis TaxID=404385 RepID=UPI003C304600
MIDEVSRTLVEVLETRAGLGPGWVEVSSLEGDATLTANKLHICMYAIDEHPHLRNAPPVSTPNGYERAPLCVRLSYVMIYNSTDHLEVQTRLARVVQVFHTVPVLGPELLRPALTPMVERLTVRLYSPPPDERTGLWTAYERGMRLALYYQVDVALLSLLDHEGHGVVKEHRIVYAKARP